MKQEEREKNTSGAYQRSQTALWEAKQRLQREGITYPVYDHALTPAHNYELVTAYAAKESAYMQEALRNPKPRPIIEFEARKDWMQKLDEK